MSSTQLLDERVVFGRDIPPAINACLQQAVACAQATVMLTLAEAV